MIPWPQTQNLPALANQVLGLQLCTALSPIHIFLGGGSHVAQASSDASTSQVLGWTNHTQFNFSCACTCMHVHMCMCE